MTEDSDELTAAYMLGLHDGRKSSQRPWVGLTDEAIKLRGEIGVLVGLLGAALQVIETVDGEDADECQMLMELQNKITYAIRGASGIKGEA